MSYIVLLVLSLSLFLPFLALSCLFLVFGFDTQNKTKQKLARVRWIVRTMSMHLFTTRQFFPITEKIRLLSTTIEFGGSAEAHSKRKGETTKEPKVIDHKCCVSVEEGCIQQL